MASIPVYQQLRPDANFTYKLIQLPPNLLSHLSFGDCNAKYLDLKTKPIVPNVESSPDDSEGNTVVVCTRDSTFKLRQNNHSNCVLLMNQRRINHDQRENDNGDNNEDPEVLMGFSRSDYVYELTQIPGLILDIVPEYSNRQNGATQSDKKFMSRNKLAELSPCSPAEFDKIYIDSCLCEITNENNDKFVYKLTQNVISQILHTFITYLISESKQTQSFTIDKLTLRRNVAFKSWQPSMIDAVIFKFTIPAREDSQGQLNPTVTSDDHLSGPLRLHDDSITRWFGIQELSKLAHSFGTPTTVADFLLNWKTALPSFYNVPLDIVQLRGHYYTANTTNTSNITNSSSQLVHFINQSSLSRDVATRFKQLLTIQSNWKYDEFVACLQPVLEHGKKVDTVILKYGKKKRVKRDQFVVCGR